VGLANILFMPVSVALKGRTSKEVAEREMAITGILAIQAGDNYRVVAQKLDTFLTAAQIAAIPEKGAGASADAAAAAEAA
jgi:chemotaxis protein MotA